MSLLRKNKTQSNCNSSNVKPDTGAISLQVVTSPSQVNENQSKMVLEQQKLLANELQTTHFAEMDLKSCDTHMKTCDSEQCKEASYNNRLSLHSVGNLLTDGNLTLRVNHMDHGFDSQATCAQMTGKDLDEMLNTGEITIQSTGGVFKVHSTNNHTITSIKFYPNTD